MRWGGGLLAFVLMAGCTKANPAKSCSDGTCRDPAFPFCDVTGAVAGEPGACIAAACTANELVECRDDVEVRCNVDGSNYNLTQCERGCSVAGDGCLLCNPGETACTNGKTATCDANGMVTNSEACALGCFEDEPRCREIDPSNGVGMYFAMAPNPPSVVFENASINTATGTVSDNGVLVDVPNFLVPAPAGGVPLRVFVFDSISITRATVVGEVGPGLVLLARGDITITGQLDVGKGGAAEGVAACNAGPGIAGATGCCASSASGGGAFGTNGAKGGDLVSTLGGSAGIANGNQTLVPLRGGCAGGLRAQGSLPRTEVGGGAVQLVSRTRILIDGVIDAHGMDGINKSWSPAGWTSDGVTRCSANVGGSSGGGILVEAPSVELGPNANLDALGGAGGMCTPATDATCGAAGTGAFPGVAATPGQSIGVSCLRSGDGKVFSAGSGGGGLGRIRINTADGTYSKSNTASEGGVTSAGVCATR